MKRIKVLALATAVLLSGCAHKMDQNECQLAQWQQIGYQDGLQGESYKRLRDHQQACSRFQIPVDGNAYEMGYKRGNNDFCTNSNPYQTGAQGDEPEKVCHSSAYRQQYQNGISHYCSSQDPFDMGVRGQNYNNVCGAAFHKEYLQGKDIYDIKNEIEEAKQEKNKLASQLVDAIDDSEKQRLKQSIDQLRDEIKDHKVALALKIAARTANTQSLEAIIQSL